jgi:diadenosine tetraphosphate (Ap4A) HIT family hydrolase
MTRIGDALLSVTNARRINYEILGNSEPELHAHIFPRFVEEAPERRSRPAWFYDWQAAPQFSADEHGALLNALRSALDSNISR